MLRDDMEKYTELTGKDATNVPIMKLGAYFDGYDKGIEVLDKIRTEILDEAEYAYADFDKYKEDILHAEPDELPDDDFRYGLHRAIEIINKYKAESEVKE